MTVFIEMYDVNKVQHCKAPSSWCHSGEDLQKSTLFNTIIHTKDKDPLTVVAWNAVIICRIKYPTDFRMLGICYFYGYREALRSFIPVPSCYFSHS